RKGRIRGRQAFDGGRLRQRTQAWHEIAAVRGGVCVGRLASRSREGVLCSGSDLRHGWWVRGGPTPLVAGDDDTVWVGGSSLLQVNPRTHHVWRMPLPVGDSVTAIAAAGEGVWVAVNRYHGRSPAQLW